MINRNFVKSGYIQALFALGMTILLSACDNLDDDATPGIAGPGSVVVTWARPMTREDGSNLPVDQIGGYRVYYGLVKGDYQRDVDITSDGTNNGMVTVGNLPAGLTFYYVVTTYDTEDRESLYSLEGSIPIS